MLTDYEKSQIIKIEAYQLEVNELIRELKKVSPHLFKEKKKQSKRFEPPTINEVIEYIALKGYHVDPVSYHAFYTSKNWMIGKNKMTSWRAALITWDRKSSQQAVNKPSTNSTFFDSMMSDDF